MRPPAPRWAAGKLRRADSRTKRSRVALGPTEGRHPCCRRPPWSRARRIHWTRWSPSSLHRPPGAARHPRWWSPLPTSGQGASRRSPVPCRRPSFPAPDRSSGLQPARHRTPRRRPPRTPRHSTRAPYRRYARIPDRAPWTNSCSPKALSSSPIAFWTVIMRSLAERPSYSTCLPASRTPPPFPNSM